MKIQEMNMDERPREKMMEKGPSALSNAELIAILLRSGTGGMNALEGARSLLSAAGGTLAGLSAASIDKMTDIPGIGEMKALSLAAAFELGRRFAAEGIQLDKISVTNAGMVYDILIPWMKGLANEECWVLFLNRSNYVISKEKLFVGGFSATTLDIRLIVTRAMEKKACGIIIAHNHPSGNPRPGKEDVVETELLRKALAAMQISLIDHIVVCDDCYFSFSEERVSPGRNKVCDNQRKYIDLLPEPEKTLK